MKILLTTDTYFPMINGVALSTRNLFNKLKKMGNDVRIMTLAEDGVERYKNGIYYLRSFGLKIYPGARVKTPFLGDMVDHILAWSPDIIHSQTEFSTMVTAKLIRRKLKVPQIHTYHTMYEDYLDYFLGGKVIRKGAAESLTKLLLNTFSGIIAPTQKVKDALEMYGVTSPIHVIPTGIELDKFQRNISDDFKERFYKEHGISDSDIILGYLGRVAEEKNIDEIIDFVKNIDDSHIKLVVVGDGPYLQNLIDKTSYFSDRIIFTGMVKPDEVYKYYKLFNIFVTASMSETQGLTYVEALSSGCPVVCRYDKAAEKLIRNGINGFMYRNKDEFMNEVRKIVYNKDLQKNMSYDAVISTKPYSADIFASNVFNIYEKVLFSSRTVYAR